MIKAVIFDLDNTLYDYDACNLIAENELLNRISEEFSLFPEESRELLKMAKKNVKERLGDDVAASHNRLLYMQNICEQIGENPLKYAMTFYDVYWNAVLREMEVYDYVLPLFNELRHKGIKIGILTDLTGHIQCRKMHMLGLADKVDAFVTSEEAGVEKPSIKMFELMLQKLGVLAEEALMIGDNQEKDIEGATNAGIKAIKFERGIDVSARTLALLK